MTKNEHAALERHFEYQHNNPPKPFNDQYNPNHKATWDTVVKSMEADGFYDNHSREECSIEFRKRLAKAVSNGTRSNIGFND